MRPRSSPASSPSSKPTSAAADVGSRVRAAAARAAGGAGGRARGHRVRVDAERGPGALLPGYPADRAARTARTCSSSAQRPGTGWTPQRDRDRVPDRRRRHRRPAGGQGVPDARGEQELEPVLRRRVRLQDQAERPEPGVSVRSRRDPARAARAPRRAAAGAAAGDGRGQRHDLRRSCPPSDGTYAVPSASGPNSSGPQYFSLVKTGGEWRISGGAVGAAAHPDPVRGRLRAEEPVLLRSDLPLPGPRPGVRAAAGLGQHADDQVWSTT